MVEIADIKDEESLEKWLTALPGDDEALKQFAVALAHRAAMRVLPLAWRDYEFADWARKRDLTALPLLRLNLISGVASTCPTPLITSAAAAAFTSSSTSSTAFAFAAAFAAAAAAADADAAAFAAAAAAADAAAAVAAAAVWEALHQDCALIQNGDDPMRAPLWDGASNPFEREWHDLRQDLEASEAAPHWEFWIRWYERALKGEAQDWAGLLTDVALIEDEVWNKGLEAVSERIDLLSQKRDLLVQIEELKAQRDDRAFSVASAAHRTHNGPPVALEDEAELRRNVTIIWDSLDAAEEELRREAPSPGRLRQFAERLLEALRVCALYCGGLADKFAQGAAEEAGKELGKAGTKWAIRGAAAAYAVQTEAAQSIGAQLLEFAQRLL